MCFEVLFSDFTALFQGLVCRDSCCTLAARLRIMVISFKLRMPLLLVEGTTCSAQAHTPGTGRAIEAGLNHAVCWQTCKSCACTKCLSSCQRSSHPVRFHALPLLQSLIIIWRPSPSVPGWTPGW